MSIIELLKGGNVSIILLLLCSVIVIMVLLERLWTIAKSKRVPYDLMRKVESMLRNGQHSEANEILEETNSLYARVLKSGIPTRENITQEEIADNLTIACDEEISNLSRPVGVLGTMGNIAPFIGLFGTVIGIMRAFHDVSQQGAGGSVVYAGISEALIATAAGLLIGIISVVTNNWLLSVIDGIRISLEKYATVWSQRLKHLGKASAETEQ